MRRPAVATEVAEGDVSRTPCLASSPASSRRLQGNNGFEYWTSLSRPIGG